MFRGLRAAALTAAIFFGAAAVAAAQPPTQRAQVFVSGGVYHVQACPAGGPEQARCFAHLVSDVAGHPIRIVVAQGGRPMHGGGSPPVSGGPYTAQQLRAAYGITGGGSSTTLVAIVDAYGYPNAAADLATYRQTYSLGSCTVATGCLQIVNETGGSSLPKANAGWDEEQALDLDMVSAMCPNCHILLVQASSASFADLATAVNTAANMFHAHSIGNSYGGGENGSGPYESAYNHPGVAVTASAGDSGYGVEFPASSPHVVAVGGTSLVLNGSTRTEYAWSGTGSGCSTVYGEPSWQLPTAPGMARNTLCSKRMLNDISAVADPNTGVIVYMNIPPYTPGFYIFGGTSASAQIISGIYGENASAPVAPLGYYSQNPYNAQSAINDVTSGSNGRCGGTYFCTAVKGYDGPTGLGTPKGDTGF